jgi:hypothetical protein
MRARPTCCSRSLRAKRYGDDVDQGGAKIKVVEETGDLVGVHVVDHEEPRAAPALGGGEKVVVGMEEGGRERGQAQGRTTDTQYDQSVESPLHLLGKARNLLAGTLGKLHPGQSPRFPPLDHRRPGVLEGDAQGLDEQRRHPPITELVFHA